MPVDIKLILGVLVGGGLAYAYFKNTQTPGKIVAGYGPIRPVQPASKVGGKGQGQFTFSDITQGPVPQASWAPQIQGLAGWLL